MCFPRASEVLRKCFGSSDWAPGGWNDREVVRRHYHAPDTLTGGLGFVCRVVSESASPFLQISSSGEEIEKDEQDNDVNVLVTRPHPLEIPGKP